MSKISLDMPVYHQGPQNIWTPPTAWHGQLIAKTETYAALFVHYDGNKNLACIGSEWCRLCEARWSRYVTGYIFCESQVSNRQALVRVTGNACSDFENWRHVNGSFENRVIELKRLGKTRGGPMIGRVLEHSSDSSSRVMPPAEQISRIARIYGLSPGMGPKCIGILPFLTDVNREPPKPSAGKSA